VLEVGCGVGAQTVHLVAASPAAHVVAVDISASSLAQARARLAAQAPGASVEWHRADLFELPFADAAFDHLFVCFVLEHLPDPVRALAGLRRVLRPGGTITVIEGDHGSAYFHPDSAHARAAIDCLVRLQSAAGGNALLGRQLQPLLTSAGYRDVTVRPRAVYADQTRPDMVGGFTLNTFTAMVGLVRPKHWPPGSPPQRTGTRESPTCAGPPTMAGSLTTPSSRATPLTLESQPGRPAPGARRVTVAT
jgi:SAM-dependent methyltransferase